MDLKTIRSQVILGQHNEVIAFLKSLQGFKASNVWAFRSHTFSPAIFRFRVTVKP